MLILSFSDEMFLYNYVWFISVYYAKLFLDCTVCTGRSTLVGVETQFTMKHKPDIFFLLMESGTRTLILHFDLIWCVRGRGQQITVES
jgi:hypothetical protein